ncbi:MAG: TolC family protein [Opitutaceae bacterium]|nr:TolC family protein [Opitutaceae bacterium]
MLVLPEQVFPQLKQVMDSAVTQSPRMILRNLDKMIAEGDLTQARAGLLPTVSGSYQMSKARDDREDQVETLETDKVYYNLMLSQPVFHWNERRNNARIGQLRRQIADRQYVEAYRTLLLEIRSAYMQMILKKIQLLNFRNEQRLSDEALALAEEKLAQKVTSEGEIFQVRIANERAHLATEYAEVELLQLKQTFSALTGQPLPSDEAIPEEIYGLPASTDPVQRMLAGFLDRGEASVPQLQIMQQQIAVEDLTLQNQRKRLLPKFNLVAGINQDEQSYTANVGLKYGVRSRYVGLQANWNIFDGFAARGATASALARKRQLEAGYKQLTEAMAQDAQRAAKHVELAFRQMQINDRMLASAREFLKYRQGDFQRGLASETDVAAAEAGVRSMFASTVSSRYTYLMRIAEFVSLVGADPAMANLDRPKA